MPSDANVDNHVFPKKTNNNEGYNFFVQEVVLNTICCSSEEYSGKRLNDLRIMKQKYDNTSTRLVLQ